MKTNKFLILSFILTLFVVVGCSDDEETLKTFDAEALSFDGVSSYDVIVPEEDASLVLGVTASTLSSAARSYDVAVLDDTTPGTSGEYTIGSVVIPANEYSGSLTVDFDFSAIGGEDGEVKELIFQIDAPDGVSAYNDVITVNYFREIVCNDLELNIVTDVWATETGFRIEQADGTIIVNDFFPFSTNSTSPQTYNASFFLPDGDYIFTLLDTFGDGQVGTGGGVTLVGNYSLTCSIITHASGEGALDGGTFESTPFTVNP